MSSRFFKLSVIISTILCISPAFAQENDPYLSGEADLSYSNEVKVDDPFEGLNRHIFGTNRFVDQIIFNPISSAYRYVVPDFGRERVDDFFSNLGTPVSFANSVLQGDVDNSFRSFWRFVINSTVGIGGIFDVASEAGLVKDKRDFGQTLGKYGAENGPYLMIPIVGPSTLRDAIGFVADMFMDPFNYIIEDEALYVARGAQFIHVKSERMDLLNDIHETSLDPYATVRSAYTQKRKEDVDAVTGSVRHPVQTPPLQKKTKKEAKNEAKKEIKKEGN